MAEILKVLQLAQYDRVAEVQIRCGRVHAELDAQRLAGGAGLLKFGAQFDLADDFRRAFLGCRRFARRPGRSWACGLIITISCQLSAVSYQPIFCVRLCPKMLSRRHLRAGIVHARPAPFQCDSRVEWVVGQPSRSEDSDAIPGLWRRRHCASASSGARQAAAAGAGRPLQVVGMTLLGRLECSSVSDSGGRMAEVCAAGGERACRGSWSHHAACGEDSYQGTPSGVPQQHSPGSRLQPLSSPANDSRPTRHTTVRVHRKTADVSISRASPESASMARSHGAPTLLPRWLRAHGGYALSLPAALARFRSFDLKLSVTQGEHAEFCLRTQQPVVAAVFANTPVYGGGMKIAPKARMDDGAARRLRDPRHVEAQTAVSVFPSVYLEKHLGIREVDYFPRRAGSRGNRASAGRLR